jgi:hypothetical protein
MLNRGPRCSPDLGCPGCADRRHSARRHDHVSSLASESVLPRIEESGKKTESSCPVDRSIAIYPLAIDVCLTCPGRRGGTRAFTGISRHEHALFPRIAEVQSPARPARPLRPTRFRKCWTTGRVKSEGAVTGRAGVVHPSVCLLGPEVRRLNALQRQSGSPRRSATTSRPAACGEIEASDNVFMPPSLLRAPRSPGYQGPHPARLGRSLSQRTQSHRCSDHRLNSFAPEYHNAFACLETSAAQQHELWARRAGEGRSLLLQHR